MYNFFVCAFFVLVLIKYLKSIDKKGIIDIIKMSLSNILKEKIHKLKGGNKYGKNNECRL